MKKDVFVVVGISGRIRSMSTTYPTYNFDGGEMIVQIKAEKILRYERVGNVMELVEVKESEV